MKHRSKTLIIISILFFGISSIGITQSVNFAETSLANLKKGSKQTEKPYFIYLFEEDCLDCQRMEQLTFQDASVANLVNGQLLATKIELNSDDGRKLAKKNKISLAPAILFYNQKGKLLLQQESALSSDNMLKLIRVLYDLDVDLSTSVTSTERFDEVKNVKIVAPIQLAVREEADIKNLKVVSAHKLVLKQPMKALRIKPAKIPVLSENIIKEAEHNNLKSPTELFSANSNPVDVQKSIAIIEAEKPAVHVLSKALKPKEAKPNAVNANLVNSTIIHKEIISEPEKKEPTPIVSSSTSKTNIIAGSSLQNRLIQFGAYTKYDDVLKGMYKMKKKLEAPLTIIEETTKGKVMYKLVSADQMTLQNAQISVNELKGRGIDCFVRKAN